MQPRKSIQFAVSTIFPVLIDCNIWPVMWEAAGCLVLGENFELYANLDFDNFSNGESEH